MNDVNNIIEQVLNAKESIAHTTVEKRNAVLINFKDNLLANKEEIIAINAKEIVQATDNNLGAAKLNRLLLDEKHFNDMIASIEVIISLPDPIGTPFAQQELQSGLQLAKMRVPLGLICFIYESRPAVTADGAALCIKSGNAVILRGGKEALNTNLAIAQQMTNALKTEGLDPETVHMFATTEREELTKILTDERIDMIIPRGSASLVTHVNEVANAMVLSHLEGNCHIYVDESANLDEAINIIINSKVQRPATCNALESLLINKAVAVDFLPKLAAKLLESKVAIMACPVAKEIIGDSCQLASDEDWGLEYLDLKISIKVIDDVTAAIAWINKYGSNHTDCILTTNADAKHKFMREVDSSSVLVNTSTRFADGYEYGLGAETGISTGKFHARGPVGLEGLTSTKWVASSDHAIRS